MLKWEYVDYRPQGFECWHAYWGKPTNKNHCEISVAKIGEKRFTIWWYDRGITDIKTHIDAEDFEEAKKIAIEIIQKTLDKRVNYWKSMADGFKKWSEEADV